MSTSFLGLLSPATLPHTLRTHPSHSLPLLAATIFGVGGLISLRNPRKGIQMFGLQDYVADSHPAQVCMQISGSQVIALSAATYIFYSKGKFAAVDTIMGTLGWVSFVGGYICFRELGGFNELVAFKWVGAGVLAACGWFGWTENGVF